MIVSSHKLSGKVNYTRWDKWGYLQKVVNEVISTNVIASHLEKSKLPKTAQYWRDAVYMVNAHEENGKSANILRPCE